MYRASRCKRSLAALATLIFFLSANALLFASHAAEEMQVAFSNIIIDASPEDPHPADHHHAHDEEDGRGGGTPHRECCSSHAPHSHDLADAPAPALISSVHVADLTFFESAAYIPEVFLDRFVPPQNLS